MSNFQTILLAIFASVFVFAVLIFSGMIKIGTDKENSIQGKVVIWGTISDSAIKEVKNKIENENKEVLITYVKKSKENYQEELIEAFANGKGPDLFIIDPGMMKRNASFIYKIPYAAYSQKSFKDIFTEGSEVYLDQEGIVGLPLYIDPIVLYYNKDILTNAGIVSVPKFWDELFDLNNILTKRDNFGKIDQSMIALGQFSNINNAKDILATLLLQNDNDIVSKRMEKSTGNTNSWKTSYISVLGNNDKNYTISPAESVLKFFLEFSNVSQKAYSWNKSFSSSLDMFIEGKVAFYIGRASELFKIEKMNPNLSFNVDKIMQVRGAKVEKTFGEINAVVISKKSTNLPSAFSVVGMMTSLDKAKDVSTVLSLPPALKSLISQKPMDNSYLHTFFDSALISRTWIDVENKQTDLIFKEMVENALSNIMNTSQAVSRASEQLGILLK